MFRLLKTLGTLIFGTGEDHFHHTFQTWVLRSRNFHSSLESRHQEVWFGLQLIRIKLHRCLPCSKRGIHFNWVWIQFYLFHLALLHPYFLLPWSLSHLPTPHHLLTCHLRRSFHQWCLLTQSKLFLHPLSRNHRSHRSPFRPWLHKDRHSVIIWRTFHSALFDWRSSLYGPWFDPRQKLGFHFIQQVYHRFIFDRMFRRRFAWRVFIVGLDLLWTFLFQQAWSEWLAFHFRQSQALV